MSDRPLPKLLTKENFQALYSRYGFSQAEAGCPELFNSYLVESLVPMTRNSMLQAEHDNRSGINRKDAVKAVEMTPEIPNGIY